MMALEGDHRQLSVKQLPRTGRLRERRDGPDKHVPCAVLGAEATSAPSL